MMGLDASGPIGVMIIAFFVLMAIVWFFLPFSIFGIKDKLDRLIALNEENNRLLTILVDLTANEEDEEEYLEDEDNT